MGTLIGTSEQAHNRALAPCSSVALSWIWTASRGGGPISQAARPPEPLPSRINHRRANSASCDFAEQNPSLPHRCVRCSRHICRESSVPQMTKFPV